MAHAPIQEVGAGYTFRLALLEPRTPICGSLDTWSWNLLPGWTRPRCAREPIDALALGVQDLTMGVAEATNTCMI